MTDDELAGELRRLGASADIPPYRRRQLLAIAEKLAPNVACHASEPDYFYDPYFRRAGLRMRMPRSHVAAADGGTLLIEPPPLAQ